MFGFVCGVIKNEMDYMNYYDNEIVVGVDWQSVAVAVAVAVAQVHASCAAVRSPFYCKLSSVTSST